MSQAPAMDFLHPRRTPVLGRWLAAFGGVALVGALAMVLSVHEARLVQEDRLSQQAQAVERLRRQALRPSVPPVDERRWQRAQTLMHQPWLSALAAIEQASRPPVYLLSLSMDPATGHIKLEGEAPSLDHALAFVQVLDEGGALAPGTLVSHERLADDPNGTKAPGVRFTALTQWRQP